jgi:hypothetical protein
MKALICPLEMRINGYRIIQIEQQEFEVALPYFWIDCDKNIKADWYWFDPSDNSFKPDPQYITEE